MNDLLMYLPVLTYLALSMVWVFVLRTFSFKFHVSLLSIFSVMNLVIIGFTRTWSDVLFGIVLLFLSVVMYLVLIYFVGGKASGETLFVIPATAALTPVPNGLLFLILGIVLLTVVGIFHLRKQLGLAKSLMYESLINSGITTYSLPDYSNLPDRSSVEKEEKLVTVIPYMFVAMLLGAIISVV